MRDGGVASGVTGDGVDVDGGRRGGEMFLGGI